MAVSLGSNISALGVQRQLNTATRNVAAISERLASGQRINRASDDAAGLAIASRLGSDQRVYSQAIRNANDGISALNIAQGALGESSAIITRLRELAEQSANGTFSRTQRVTMDKEAAQLTAEYNRIVASTNFNGLNLFGAGQNPLSIQLGYGENGQITFSYSSDINRKSLTGYTYSSPYSGSGFQTITRNGDINSDGRDDLVIYDPADSGYLQVRLSQADGTFTVGSKIRFDDTITGLIGDFKIFDANADGRQDIVIGTTTTTAVKFNQGAGTFNGSTTIGAAAWLLVTGDFNGDGRTDIFSSNAASSGQVILASGSGFAAAVTNTLASSYSSFNFASADTNSDGRDEIIYLTSGLQVTSVTFNQGKLSTLNTTGTNVDNFAIGDIDHDGTQDLITSTGGVSSVQKGNGDGTYAAATNLGYTMSGFGSIRDLDGDGLTDLFYTTDDGDATLTYWRKGDGNGNFGSEQAIDGGGRSGVLGQLADFNGDGLLDSFLDSIANPSVAISKSEDTTAIARQDLTTRQAALVTLSYLDTLASNIGKALGKIGAAQSRIGASLSVLQASQENFAAAEGRIKDADVAFESAALARFQILQQTASSLLASANQQPALALQLLR